MSPQPPLLSQTVPPPAQKKSGCMPGCLVAGVVGVVLLVIGVVALAIFGLSLTADQVGEKLATHPAVVEAVGEVQDFSGNLTKSAEDPDPDLFYYDIVGTKGRAMVAVKSESVSADEERILSAVLILPSGERISLVEDGDTEFLGEEVEPPESGAP